MALSLTEEDYQNAADALSVDVASVKAVAEVESAGDGYLANGKVKILFERHWFSRLTNRKFDKKYPGISNAIPGGYKGGVAEWARFTQASNLNAQAAMMATSWGRFQLMGFNHLACGFATVQEFVNAMQESDAAQLLAFVEFVKSKDLDDELQRQDWAGFARGYNGPAYRKNKYDSKLAAAYKKHGGSETPEARSEVLAEQISLPAVPSEVGTQINFAPPTQAPPEAPIVKHSLVPQEEPKQVTTGGEKAWYAQIASQVSVVGGGVWAALAGNWKILAVVAGFGAIAFLAWFARNTILDVYRLKAGADPTKYNVK